MPAIPSGWPPSGSGARLLRVDPRHATFWLLAPLLAVLVCACSPEQGSRGPSSAGDGGPPTVYASFYPLEYFADRIGGELVNVVCPLPEGADPELWRPDDETLRDLQSADLVLVNGAGFERWVRQASLPLETLVDTSRPFRESFLHHEEVHSHGAEGAHSHRRIDGHTWMDPANARRQAEAVRTALARLLPEQAAELERRGAELDSELGELDARLRQLGSQPAGEVLLANRPTYGYLARAYGWRIVSVPLEPDELPGPEAFEELRTRLREHSARFLIWESTPRREVAELLEDDFGLESVVFSPCEVLPAAEREQGVDYLAAMRENVLRLAPAIGH